MSLYINLFEWYFGRRNVYNWYYKVATDYCIGPIVVRVNE